MARSKKKVDERLQELKKSESILESEVDAIEEFYYHLTGIETQQFSDSFKVDLKEIVRKYGVDSVFEAVPASIKTYGENALDKLIAIVICNSNPKYKANYICGIIKNKLRVRYINRDVESLVKYAVSEIVDFDNGKSDAIDSVIDEVKRFDLDTFDEYLDLINDAASRRIDLGPENTTGYYCKKHSYIEFSRCFRAVQHR